MERRGALFKFLNLFLCFLAVLHGMWDLSSPLQGWIRHLLQCKCGVLTTGLPGNSRVLFIEKEF